MSKKRKKKGSQPVMRKILARITLLCYISALYTIGWYWYQAHWTVKNWGTDVIPSYTGEVASVEIRDEDGYCIITMNDGNKFTILPEYMSGNEQAEENGWADSQLFHPTALKVGSVVTVEYYAKDQDPPMIPIFHLYYKRAISVFDDQHVYLDGILTYNLQANHLPGLVMTLVFVLVPILLPFALYGLVVILCWIYDIRDKREHAKKLRLRAERLAAQKEKSDF